MEHRSHRVEDLLRAELSTMMLRDLKDPRVKLASIANLTVSGDLSHAVIYVSVLGDDQEMREECIQGLKSASGYLRRQLASRLRLRTIPELEFQLDRGAEHSQHISELLDEIVDHDRDGDSEEETASEDVGGKDG